MSEPPVPGHRADPTPIGRERGLEEVLRRLFGAHELQRFLSDLPDGRDIVDSIAWVGVSLLQIVYTTVDVLSRRQEINARFFESLRSERPGRAEDIDACEDLWLGTGATDVEAEGRDQRPWILWVDDKPTNIASRLEQLQAAGYRIASTDSTTSARDLIGAGARFAAVLSDMGRSEKGRHNPRAGLDLLIAVRQARINVPFIIITDERGDHLYGREVESRNGHSLVGKEHANDVLAVLRRYAVAP